MISISTDLENNFSERILKVRYHGTTWLWESNGKIILIGEHAVTFGEPAIAIPFTSGKVKVLIESLEKGNYSAIQSDVYDGPLYDAPEHLKSLIGHFVENKR